MRMVQIRRLSIMKNPFRRSPPAVPSPSAKNRDLLLLLRRRQQNARLQLQLLQVTSDQRCKHTKLCCHSNQCPDIKAKEEGATLKKLYHRARTFRQTLRAYISCVNSHDTSDMSRKMSGLLHTFFSGLLHTPFSAFSVVTHRFWVVTKYV